MPQIGDTTRGQKSSERVEWQAFSIHIQEVMVLVIGKILLSTDDGR